jgi:His/Glu/Gln/Arg/opine family amino acid ABC transporter permease subunit
MDTLVAYAPLLARGALTTIALALTALALATTLGAVAAAAKIGGGGIARGLVFLYTGVVRGVPDLVMILLIYFGGQRLVNAVAGAFGEGTVALSPFWAGVIAIGFIYGAYLARPFRGAYMTIPRGQMEAGRALGMRGFPLVARVVVPQLLRFALPGYGNVWQVLVKSTAVVSVIGLEDLVGSPTTRARPRASRSFPVRGDAGLSGDHLGLVADARPSRAPVRVAGPQCALTSSWRTGGSSPRACG